MLPVGDATTRMPGHPSSVPSEVPEALLRSMLVMNNPRILQLGFGLVFEHGGLVGFDSLSFSY